MKFKIIMAFLLLAAGFKFLQPLFYNKLLSKRTVSQVIKLIENDVTERLKESGVIVDEVKGAKLFIVALKKEKLLQVYRGYNSPVLLKSYSFTGYSGELGPKNKEGDGQIPEGIYDIEGLNPNSSYHLSLKINYPNSTDRSRARVSNIRNPGTNIFIHGKDVTVGCIPIGDEAIEELFYLVELVGKDNVRVALAPQQDISLFKYKSYAVNEIDEDFLKVKYEGLKDILKSFREQH